MFTMLRDNLEKANRAPRCDYPRSGGRPCRAPKVRGEKYCCMHLAMEATRPTKFSLPALDDANSIQVALNKTAQGLVDGTLDEKVATKLAYVLQVAMSNVGKLDFEPEESETEEVEQSASGRWKALMAGAPASATLTLPSKQSWHPDQLLPATAGLWPATQDSRSRREIPSALLRASAVTIRPARS